MNEKQKRAAFYGLIGLVTIAFSSFISGGTKYLGMGLGVIVILLAVATLARKRKA